MKVRNDCGVVNGCHAEGKAIPKHPICLIRARVQHRSVPGGFRSRTRPNHPNLYVICARIQDSRWPRILPQELFIQYPPESSECSSGSCLSGPDPGSFGSWILDLGFGPEEQSLRNTFGVGPEGTQNAPCWGTRYPHPIRPQAPVAPKQADGPVYEWPEGQRQKAGSHGGLNNQQEFPLAVPT